MDRFQMLVSNSTCAATARALRQRAESDVQRGRGHAGQRRRGRDHYAVEGGRAQVRELTPCMSKQSETAGGIRIRRGGELLVSALLLLHTESRP